VSDLPIRKKDVEVKFHDFGLRGVAEDCTPPSEFLSTSEIPPTEHVIIAPQEPVGGPYTDADWEPGGRLGNDPKYARKAPAEVEKQINDILGIVPYTLRLRTDVVTAFETIAKSMGKTPMFGAPILMRIALDKYIEDWQHKQDLVEVSKENGIHKLPEGHVPSTSDSDSPK
jgi:hypothetical protein